MQPVSTQSAPALSPEEDLRRTKIVLGELGLTGDYLELYASALTLKDAIGTAFAAANFSGDRMNHFRPFVTQRLGEDRSSKAANSMLGALMAQPWLLSGEELQRLARSLKRDVKSRNAAFLDCSSAQLLERERYSAEYGGDPTLIFLKAAGIRNPERMDHCGFIDAVYKFNLKDGVLSQNVQTFLPLPLMNEGSINKFLSHPTPAFAAQLGRSFRRSPKILEITAKWSDRIDGRSNAFEHFEGRQSQEEKEQRFARRWVVQYLMEHLHDTATGRPVSPLDTTDYIVKDKKLGFKILHFQAVAGKPAKTQGLIEFLRAKVDEGKMHYNGEIPLAALCREEEMHRFGAQLLAQSRERSAQLAQGAARG